MGIVRILLRLPLIFILLISVVLYYLPAGSS